MMWGQTMRPSLIKAQQNVALVLVDDDLALLHALGFAFETEGYDVRAFADAESLLADADAQHGSVCLVLDQRLPGMSGLALLAALRAQNVAAPAILITSNPSPAVRREARAAGAEIVEKPLLDGILAQKVRDAIHGASPD
jgi:two-component system, LuxR family, response regulator FixJ